MVNSGENNGGSCNKGFRVPRVRGGVPNVVTMDNCSVVREVSLF